MIHPRPGHLAPLLASITVGALLAGAGLTLGVAPDAALLDAPSGASSVSGALTVDVPTPPLSPTASPDGAVGPAPTTATQPPALPKAGSATRKPSARPAPGAPVVVTAVVMAVAAATNAERAAAGCAPLRLDSRLNTAAQRHTADMASTQELSHTGGDGSSFADRIRAAGFPRPGAENIAAGQPTAASVVSDWMDSSGHRRNILNCSYTAIGVGFDARGNYWTQNFGF